LNNDNLLGWRVSWISRSGLSIAWCRRLSITLRRLSITLGRITLRLLSIALRRLSVTLRWITLRLLSIALRLSVALRLSITRLSVTRLGMDLTIALLSLVLHCRRGLSI